MFPKLNFNIIMLLYYTRKPCLKLNWAKYIGNKLPVVRLSRKSLTQVDEVNLQWVFVLISLQGLLLCRTPAVTIHCTFLSTPELLSEHMGARRTKELGQRQPSSGLPFRWIAALTAKCVCELEPAQKRISFLVHFTVGASPVTFVCNLFAFHSPCCRKTDQRPCQKWKHIDKFPPIFFMLTLHFDLTASNINCMAQSDSYCPLIY